jgi:hypothetical protein
LEYVDYLHTGVDGLVDGGGLGTCKQPDCDMVLCPESESKIVYHKDLHIFVRSVEKVDCRSEGVESDGLGGPQVLQNVMSA